MNSNDAPKTEHRLERAADSLRRLKKLWSEHTAGVLLSAAAAVYVLGWASNAVYLDFTGRAIASKQLVDSAIAAQSEISDLRLQLERASRERKESELKSSLDAERLIRQIAELELSQSQLRDKLHETSAAARDQSARERAAAERRESEYKQRIAGSIQENQALRSDFPSLIARGLWDNGKPSARAMSLARNLPSDWSSAVLASLESTRVPSAAKAELAELTAQYQDANNRCDPAKAELASAEAAYCVNFDYYCSLRRYGEGRPFTGGTQEQWDRHNREKAAAQAAVASAKAKERQCTNYSDSLLRQIGQVLRRQ